MKKRVCLFAFIFILGISSVSFAAQKYIEILLDVSASMKEKLEGKAKIDIAKEAVTSVLTEIPDDMPLGLWIYGARYSATASEEENCKAVRLLVPVAAQSKNEIRDKVAMLTPLGFTPIAYSLEQATGDFPDKNADCSIILISDGKETCGGDPAATARSLKERGYKIVVHTVGFDVDEATRAQLKAIADAAGGMYMDASNAAALGSSLVAITQKIRESVSYEEQGEVAPGKGFTNATQVQLDQVYSHDIVIGEEHFYKVPVKKGEEIAVVLTMKRKSVGPGWDAGPSPGGHPGDEAKQLNVSDAEANKNYGNPASFTYVVKLYDSDSLVVSGGSPLVLSGDRLDPDSTRLMAKMPFSGEAYISVGLKWKYEAAPKFCMVDHYISCGGRDEKKWRQWFDENRSKADNSAYYTLKIRKAE